MIDPSCKLCPLWETATSVCIGGKGPEQADILIVGQNPGKEEDLEGECFVGRSGKLLEDMLVQAGIDLSKVRITNAVKCYTPGNQKPTPQHLNACRGYLRAEIAACRPRLIIALGDTALQSLCKTSGVQAKRGSSVPLHGDFDFKCEVWPTYHPAFVLRQPNARSVVVADIRRIRDSALPRDDVKWEWWEPGKELPDGVLSYDIETDYLGDGRITQAAISDGATAWVAGEQSVPEFLGTLASKRSVLIGHNSWQFDDPISKLTSTFDTMAMAYLCDESQPLGLEPLAVRYLGVRGWKDDFTAELGSDTFAAYNARDAIFTHRLFERLRAELGTRMRLVELLHASSASLDECTKRGIWISRTAVAAAREKYEAERKIYAAQIPCENPNSGRQIGKSLCDEGHILPLSATGQRSSTALVLKGLDQTPLVQAVHGYRKVAKAINAYVKPYEKITNEGDGRAHATYRLLRTTTGRTSAVKPAIQTIPRDPVLRAFFSAPEGKVLVSADYSTLEFRTAGWVAQEPTIIQHYSEDPDWDAHTWFARIMYGKETITKEERQIAKSANFGLLYMQSPDGLQKYILKTIGLHVELPRCRTIHKLWHQTFPYFDRWYAQTWGFIKEHGYIQTATGRRRHCGDTKLMNRHGKAEALRELVNVQVQSLANDIALMGMNACREAGLPICAFIHDDVKCEFDRGEWDSARDRLVTTIADCLAGAPIRQLKSEYGVNFNVPLTVEIKES